MSVENTKPVAEFHIPKIFRFVAIREWIVAVELMRLFVFKKRLFTIGAKW